MLRKFFPPRSGSGFLRALLRPARHRRQAWLTIAALTALVCLIDFYAPLEVALTVVYLPTVLLATASLGRSAGVKVALVEAPLRIVVDIVIVYPEPVPWFRPWHAIGALFVYLLIVWLLDALLTMQHQLERDFADDLGVNLKTVQTYCARIKEKIGIVDRLKLSHVAFRWHEHETRPTSG